jgi:hypothetical protein
MGLFKQVKDMRATLHEAPQLVEQAQAVAAAQAATAAQASSAGATVTAVNASLDPADPRLAPIAGVDIVTYARIAKTAAKEGLDEAGMRLRAAAFGVPASPWDEAAAGWASRMRGDTALAVHYATMYRRVQI